MRWIARVRPLAEVVPAVLFDVHVVIVGRLLDIGERDVPLGVRNILHLVKPSKGIDDVRSVGQRLLALPREGVNAIGQRLAVVSIQLTVSGLGQNYSIDWFTIDGGGGTSTGGVYAVSGTIGQPDAGLVCILYL